MPNRSYMKAPRPERDVLESVRELLKARGILHFRRNVTKLRDSRGKWIEFGTPGEADIEALVWVTDSLHGEHLKVIRPVFIECKSSQGKQSMRQRIFQRMVEDYGCTYLLVRTASQVNDWLNENM